MKTEETLSWWRNHESLFPLVAKVALRCFVVPATNAFIESTFSKAKYIMTPERSSMSGETFNNLLFLKCNSNLWWSMLDEF